MFSLYINLFLIEHNLFKPVSESLGNKLRSLFSRSPLHKFDFLLTLLLIPIHFVLQECYVHNLLRVTVYLPTLRLQILELIIEKLLKLDVSLFCVILYGRLALKYTEQEMKYASVLDSTKNAFVIMSINLAKFTLHSQDKDVPTPEGNSMVCSVTLCLESARIQITVLWWSALMCRECASLCVLDWLCHLFEVKGLQS